MVRLLVVLAAIAIVMWGHRRAPARVHGSVSRMLGLFAGTAILLHLLLAAAALPQVPRVFLGAVGVVVALLNWAAVSWLIGCDARKRDTPVRAISLGVAAITALAGAPWGVSAGFATAAIWSFRWKREFDTVALFRIGCLGLALFAFRALRVPGVGAPLAGSPIEAVRWAGTVSTFYIAFGVLAVFAAFVRDPSLGIRSVTRRLALSHVLVVLVPLALMAGLWVLTTLLGVNAERARVAARQLQAESELLEASLGAALASPDPVALALAALADATAPRWPKLRIWLDGGGAWVRVRGEGVTGESQLSQWPARRDSVPSHGVLWLADSLYLAARVRAAGHEAIALAPLRAVLEGAPARVADAHVRAHSSAVRTDGASITNDAENDRSSAPAESLSVADSLALARARGVARRLGIPDSALQSGGRARGVTINTGGQAFSAATSDSNRTPFFLRGWAQMPGLAARRGGFSRSEFLISAYQSPGRVLGELFRGSRANPVQWLPLALLVPITGLFLLVALFDLVMVTNMGRSIAAAIGALREGAARLEAGDLSHRIEVGGKDDLWSVAVAFNRASAGLERARELEKEADRIEGELELARRIHARLLPAEPPVLPGLDIAGLSESAREVGGDYFDHIDVGGGRVLLVVADVSGKGVPAALIMSAFRASLMSQDSSRPDPARLAGRLNDFLHRSVEPGKFVTAFLGFLDAASGRLSYVNAGHNPPVLLRADGTHELLDRGGTILGILPAPGFESGDVTIEPGDLLALYTDGVTEGLAASGEMWGEDRLVEGLRREAARPSREIARRLVDEVRAFEGEQGPADDITLVVAKRPARF